MNFFIEVSFLVEKVEYYETEVSKASKNFF